MLIYCKGETVPGGKDRYEIYRPARGGPIHMHSHHTSQEDKLARTKLNHTSNHHGFKKLQSFNA